MAEINNQMLAIYSALALVVTLVVALLVHFLTPCKHKRSYDWVDGTRFCPDCLMIYEDKKKGYVK